MRGRRLPRALLGLRFLPGATGNLPTVRTACVTDTPTGAICVAPTAVVSR
jgi:hypothetical protein